MLCGLFSIFSNSNHSFLHKGTCVAIANPWWSMSKSRIIHQTSLDLVMIIWKCMYVVFLNWLVWYFSLLKVTIESRMFYEFWARSSISSCRNSQHSNRGGWGLHNQLITHITFHFDNESDTYTNSWVYEDSSYMHNLNMLIIWHYLHVSCTTSSAAKIAKKMHVWLMYLNIVSQAILVVTRKWKSY